ncbi:hypothetical protein [Mangrovicoccus sp. HB161399]|uniref:hypothetical protein n=1 Tax=Mangrovicoccus sp. HB161399 TaxID=2720392 RepID=UPI0020A64E5B|nr:hypothetical protein [Mangrovicoccus sp. HB161399]
MTRAGLLCTLALAACGGLTELGEEPARPYPAARQAPAGLAGAGTAEALHPDRLERDTPVPNVTPYAAEAQLRRIDDLATGIASLPATAPVPAADTARLRQQRVQAQAISSSRPLSRPGFGTGSGTPDFTPVATADPMVLGIQRAQAAEAAALNRR